MRLAYSSTPSTARIAGSNGSASRPVHAPNFRGRFANDWRGGTCSVFDAFATNTALSVRQTVRMRMREITYVLFTALKQWTSHGTGVSERQGIAREAS